MRLTFLGTGTSVGVPTIGCKCEVCSSTDPRDKRLRCSALVETDNTRVLIDAGPDFRQQMLTQEFSKIDAILLTHIHYDHVGGIDDIRPFCKFGEVNVYADEATSRGVMHTVPYCFSENHYPGAPKINLHTIYPHDVLRINELEIIPFVVLHDRLPIMGYRIGRLAYITDMKSIDDSEISFLDGVDVLVVNALRFFPEHHSHQNVADALRFADRVGAKRTFLIHVNHDIGLHEEVNKKLPSNVRLAYDGLSIIV